MISVANQGAGQRRVDLALIPSQASRTTEVFKTFTADQESGVIGGIINIVPYSAFEDGDKFYVDTFASYSTYDKVPGGNSPGGYDDTPWGGGIKQLWSKRLGSDDQFGVVISSVYQQRTSYRSNRNRCRSARARTHGPRGAHRTETRLALLVSLSRER
jgi:iron complex outermembrane recepter protein